MIIYMLLFYHIRYESATTPVITGDKGVFSGTIKLSIPLKNGSFDNRHTYMIVYYTTDFANVYFAPHFWQCRSILWMF